MEEQRPKSEPPADIPDDDAPLTEELVAYLDGELGMAGNEAVEAKISVDPTVRAEADALKKTWDLLDYLPRPEPSPNFTERTLSKLEPIRQLGSNSSPSGPTVARNGSTTLSPQASTTNLPAASFKTPRQKLLTAIAWMLLFAGAGSAGYFVRDQIVRMHELRISDEAREEKTVALYAFVTSEHFKQLVEQVETQAGKMLDLDSKEQEAHRRLWDARAKLIRSVQKARSDLTFEIDRIIGTAGNGPVEDEEAA